MMFDYEFEDELDMADFLWAFDDDGELVDPHEIDERDLLSETMYEEYWLEDEL